MNEAGAVRPQLRFGLFLGQAGKTWPQILDEFLLAEELGYDHAWLVDHLVPTDGPQDVAIHEAWTLLSALAARTSRIRLGVLVSNNLFRHPALLAKMAVTVDHVSDGRLILGLGSGWFADEHRRYGFDFPEPPDRVDRFSEAVEVIHALLGGGPVTYDGRHYRLEDAPLAPLPVQRPRMPLLIAAHRPRMLRIAARFADIWDTFPVIPGAATETVTESVPDQAARVDEYLREAGRDPGELRRSTWVGGAVAASDERWLDFVERHVALGFTDLTTSLPGRSERAALERICRHHMPTFRARGGQAAASTTGAP